MNSDGKRAVRRTGAGDISPNLSPGGIEDYVVGEAMDGAVNERLNVVRDVLANARPEDRLAVARWLNAIVDGSSPDELPACAGSSSSRTSRCTARSRWTPTTSSSRHWRSGVYPYKNLMSRKTYERAEVPPAGRAAEAAGLGQGHRAACRDPVRGPRRRRQGRDDQALHGAPEPPRRARGRAREADSGRAGPVVLPALRAAPADAGRDRPVRPLLVQPRRRRAGHGLLHATPSSRSSCARRPSSSAT